jgi:hypothetical protein
LNNISGTNINSFRARLAFWLVKEERRLKSMAELFKTWFNIFGMAFKAKTIGLIYGLN